MKFFDVYLGNRHIDTLFCPNSFDTQEVKRGLVEHDGYNPEIEVRKRKPRKFHNEVAAQIADQGCA